MSGIKNLTERLNKILNEDEDKDIKNANGFCEKFQTIIENEFKPVAQKLNLLVHTFKQLYPDTNEYSLPIDISRDIDYLALTAANIFDELNGDKKMTKKIRKALGYDM